MEISTKYNPKELEDKWYAYWLHHKFFESKPDHREPYTIVIPPPNVTGVLHMGHMLNNTIQDVLIRRARMKGKNALWVPGTDHASIATEAKVVKMLKEEKGIDKKSLTRDQFLDYCWEWTHKYGGIILDQLKKLGASCDWSRTRFTMEPELSAAVIKVFVDMYERKLIYRGYRMVNWDPQGKTAVSDEEVIHKEVKSKLYYVRYAIVGSDDFITIATTRPETILADTAICVHPTDERFAHLVGKKAIVPMAERQVPIIADEYVDPAFGTGCLKVTPAHDVNDYALGQKHKLDIIDMLDETGKVNAKVSFYVGDDRFVARKKIVKDLEERGHVVKIEDITNKVGYSERTDAVIEPRLSVQWFVDMKNISKEALENVMNDNIKLYPPKFKNTYKHWMENVHDWCISRQLWWGQRIPAFYLPNGEFVVAETIEEALVLAKKLDPKITASQLKQDEDVLDTWFSSWLWPISVFDGITKPNNPDIQYYYPTNDLVTAPEILFFWVARMIIAGYQYKGEKPFTNVYLTGIVRDKLGRKMSKSLGNSPDPLDLIEKYGADGVRTGMLFSSPAGNDLPFDEKLVEQGRNFANKIWNAFRLVKGWEVVDVSQPEANKVAIRIFQYAFDKSLEEIDNHFNNYRISDALLCAYKLMWDEFCAEYLENIKPPYGQPIDPQTYDDTIKFFEGQMKLLHPFMPFLTEEIWHTIDKRDEKDCVTVAQWPVYDPNQALIDETGMGSEAMKIVVNSIRNVRNSKQISPKESLELHIRTESPEFYQPFEALIKKRANISVVIYTKTPSENSSSFIHKGDEFFVPLAGNMDVGKEREKLLVELERAQKLLSSADQKLSNEKFMANASVDIVWNERTKKADAESKIAALVKQLESLKTA